MTENEKEILYILWQSNGKPLTSKDIEQQLDPSKWNTPKLFRLLNAMQKKKLIGISGFKHDNKHYTRQFIPLISQEDYYVDQLQKDGVNTKTLLRIATSFLGGDLRKKSKIDDKIINDLRNMLNELPDDQ